MSDTENLDAEAMLRAIQNNDNAAYTYFVNKYSKKSLNFANNILHNITNAEDAVGEMLEALVEHSRSIRSGSALVSWMYTTLRNRAYNMQKQLKRCPAVSSDKLERLINKSGVSTDNMAEMMHIRDCLAKLRPDEQRVLFMRLNNASWREMCGVILPTPSKNRTLYKNSIKKFKKFYKS
ncbi:sigma-70 family RNA polymerase sigma factor [Pumilibacter intestinalis]|uniref:RNA polymerase sigma factor n=1 Tax=Pumilibacter intestinalis TaxID=2941511 RepID=UPI003083F7C4